jgi:hypothetical protein
MLRDGSGSVDRSWTGAARVLSASCLFAVALTLAASRGPARAGDDAPKPRTTDAPHPGAAAAPGRTPFDLSYVPDSMPGVVAFRPAATFHKPGMARFARLIRDGFESDIAAQFKVDASKPGFPHLNLDEVEWVVTGLDFGRGGKNKESQDMHTILVRGLAVRMTRPFDWLALLRAWRFEFEEVREEGRVYHKVVGLLKPLLGPGDGCVYLPDDRTLVFNELGAVRAAVRRGHSNPIGLTDADRDALSQSMLAVVLDNRGDSLLKKLDLGRPNPEDAVALSLVKGVDRWTIRTDDADPIALHATASCRDPGSAARIASVFGPLVKAGLKALEEEDPDSLADESNRKALAMSTALLRNLKVTSTGSAVELHTGLFGAFADLGALLEAEARQDQEAAAKARDSAARASDKTRKR